MSKLRGVVGALRDLKRSKLQDFISSKKNERAEALFARRHAHIDEIINGHKEDNGEATPKRAADTHLDAGERSKRRREFAARSAVAANRQTEPEHYIDYQMRTGVPPLNKDEPEQLLRHEKTLRLAHLNFELPTLSNDADSDDDDDYIFLKKSKINSEPSPEFPPVFGTKIMSLDAEFVKRKGKLGEKTCELPDGRKLAFWMEGDPEGVNVLCFHDGCEGKSRFIQKERIPGMRLIAIDRPGYGGSDFASGNYSFECAVRDVTALVNYLNIKKFVVLGHGVGGAWAQQLAAALPDRVLGAILWSSMVDPLHDKATGDVRRAVGYSDALHYRNTGHIGPSPRHFMRGTTTAVAKDDFGVLGLHQESTEGPTSFKKFTSDRFWVSCMVDTWKRNRDRSAIMSDVNKTLLSQWAYDTQNIKCPVFVFHGDGDKNAKCPVVTNFLKELIPHAEVEIMKGYGHICSFGPDLDTRSRIERAVSAMIA